MFKEHLNDSAIIFGFLAFHLYMAVFRRRQLTNMNATSQQNILHASDENAW
jgi:hypothetical protein